MGGDQATRDVPQCVRDAVCIEEVAQSVARQAGAQYSLPVPRELYETANANAVLIDRMVELYASEAYLHSEFNDTLFETHQAAKEHDEAIASLKRRLKNRLWLGAAKLSSSASAAPCN